MKIMLKGLIITGRVILGIPVCGLFMVGLSLLTLYFAGSVVSGNANHGFQILDKYVGLVDKWMDENEAK